MHPGSPHRPCDALYPLRPLPSNARAGAAALAGDHRTSDATRLAVVLALRSPRRSRSRPNIAVARVPASRHTEIVPRTRLACRGVHKFWRAFAMAVVMAGTSRATPPSLPGLQTVSATSTDGPIPIPDNNPSGVLLSLTLPGLTGSIVDVDVGVDIQHASPGQLRIQLMSPSGTLVTLSSNTGGNNADAFAGVLFDDQAPAPTAGASAANVRNFTYAPGTPIGTVQPEQPLGVLLGEPAAGTYGLSSTWFLLVRDESGGTSGTLRSWSLAVSTVPTGAFQPGAPTHAQYDAGGTGDTIPDNDANGLSIPLAVAGLGPRLHDAEVTVDIAHPNSGDLELLLRSPAGTQIDLVTRLGGGNDDLYAGVTFTDAAGAPISDATLPPSGTTFTRVSGEGALTAFVGEDPNGTWTLIVRDRAGGSTGRLRHWSLDIRTSNPCGDGVLDAGEACDDGNLVDGDGCDSNCTPTGCGNGIVTAGEDCDDGNTVDGDTCPATCRQPEAVCDDCIDNDGDGLADAADPGCMTDTLQLVRARFVHGRLTIVGFIPVITPPTGPLALVIADARGTQVCTGPGEIGSGPRGRRVSSAALGGTVTVALKGAAGDKVVVSGRHLAPGSFTGTIALGIDVGGRRYSGSGTLRTRGIRSR